ncbi:hypothetical protein K2X40_01960 [Candidatus Babeliales bacterium]|nr:hypothetical protein [Candidatus Babeliales bacterium]
MKFLRTTVLGLVLATTVINTLPAAAEYNETQLTPLSVDHIIEELTNIQDCKDLQFKIATIRRMLTAAQFLDISSELSAQLTKFAKAVNEIEERNQDHSHPLYQHFTTLNQVGLGTTTQRLIDLLTTLQAPVLSLTTTTPAPSFDEEKIKDLLNSWSAQLPYRDITTREVIVLQVIIPLLINLLEPAATEFKQLEPDDATAQGFGEGAYVAVCNPLFKNIKLLLIIGNICVAIYETYKEAPRMAARAQRAARAARDNCTIL